MNKLFISNKMTAKSVIMALEFPDTESKQVRNIRIRKLVEQGYIKKDGLYYTPTDKMLYECYLPETIILTIKIRFFLNMNKVFTKKELVSIFDGNDIIVNWLKLNGYIYQSSDCRYRKTDKLDELLADGEEEISTN
jgi:hypothetical protein